MKRRIFFAAAALFLFTLTLSACTKGSSASAKFLKDEFIISKYEVSEEVIDFFDYVSLKNVKKEDVTFSVTKPELFKSVDGGYAGVQSGRGLVQVKYNGSTLASAPIIVKHVFDAPTNFVVSEGGLLNWDAPFVYVENEAGENQITRPTSYTVICDNQQTEVTPSRPQDTTIQFQLPHEGEMEISIVANGNKYVDSSKQITIFESYYAMERISNFNASVDEDFDNNLVSLSWDKDPLARYKVSVGGVEIYSNFNGDSVDLDFANYGDGQSVEIKLEAFDPTKEKFSSYQSITVTKPSAVEFNYNLDEVAVGVPSGQLAWSKSNTGYLVKYVNLKTGDSGIIEIEDIAELDYGTYEFYVRAKGGYYKDNFYSKSRATTKVFAILPKPEFTYRVQSGKLEIDFIPSSYGENYKIEYGGLTAYLNTAKSGNHISLPLDLDGKKGEQALNVTSLPCFVNDDILKELDGQARVLNSRVEKRQYYLFDTISSLIHSLDSDGNSILTFAKDENAEYKLTINGETTEVVPDEKGQINIGRLGQPNGKVYNLTLTAYRKDGAANEVRVNKTLTILDAVSKAAANQENGLFAWEGVSGECEYEYYIYKVDKDFVKGGTLGELVAHEVTQDTKIKEKLDFGYYYIKIYTRATESGINNYLDADFVDGDSYFEYLPSDGPYFVTKALTAPTLSFDSDSKILTIESEDEFTYKYVIKIDGREVANVYRDGNIQKTYDFTIGGQLKGAGDYNISVEAVASDAEAQIHTKSPASEIVATKLATPKITIDKNEVLSVSANSQALKILVQKDGQELELNGGKLSLLGFTSDFSLSITYIAKPDQDNNYYIDSDQLSYNFKRLLRPTNIEYQNGILTFVDPNESTDGYAGLTHNYSLILTVVGRESNYVVQRYLDAKTFDLDGYIQSQLEKDSEFASAYEQCVSVKVQIKAYKNESEGNTYYLPSLEGHTLDGQSQLTLESLVSAQISFSKEDRTLNWEAVGSLGNTTYTIYVDGEVVREDYSAVTETGGKRMVSYKLDIDFTRPRTVMVIANNPHYLSSASSNVIIVSQLAPISSLNVNQAGDASITISNPNQIDKVLINGNEASGFDKVNGFLSFNVADLGEQVNLQLISVTKIVQQEVEYYYLDSQLASFTFKDLADQTITPSLAGDKITWNNVADDFNGEGLTYSVIIYNGNIQVDKISGIQETQLLLSSQVLYGLGEGDYEVQIITEIANYQLSSGTGYYGVAQSDKQLSLSKLQAVEDVNIVIVEDDTTSRETLRKSNASVKFEILDNWSSFSGVTFEVEIGGTKLVALTDAGASGTGYTFEKVGSKYILTLDKTFFTELETEVKFEVAATNAIKSNDSFVTIERLENINGLSLSADAILTIDAAAAIKEFFYEITIGGHTIYDSSDSPTIDLSEKFGDLSGMYDIGVIGYDSTDKKLASRDIVSIKEGYRLKGISDIQINDYGTVEITLYEEQETQGELEFWATYNNESKQFTPDKKENGVRTYSMGEFISLFEINVSGSVSFKLGVAKVGNVNSPLKEFKFNYTSSLDKTMQYLRGKDMADDYIVIGYDANARGIKITADTVLINGTKGHYEQSFQPSSLHGFWIEDENGYHFDTIRKTKADRECYAINVNDFFKSIGACDAQIKVEKTTFKDDTWMQSYSNFTIRKLDKTNNLRLSNNILSWSATDATGYYVYFTTTENDEKVDRGYEYVTAANIDLYDKLIPGLSYSIQVVSVSNDTLVLASEPTTEFLTTKYATPATLTVENGHLMFSREDVINSDFFNAIKTSYGTTNFYSMVGNTNFSSPFSFSGRSIEYSLIKLTFTSSEGNGTYTATVNAAQLMPDLSTLTFQSASSGTDTNCLEALMSALDGNGTIPYWNQVMNILNAMLDSNGIADNEMLFDDFGKQIPAGSYKITAMQTVYTGYNNVSSNQSPANSLTINGKEVFGHDVYLPSAPAITLSSDTKDSRNNYYVTFTLTDIMENGKRVSANLYTLHLKGENSLYCFNVEKVDDKYLITSFLIQDKDNKGRIIYNRHVFNEPIELAQNIQDGKVLSLTLNMRDLKTHAYNDGKQDKCIDFGGNSYMLSIYTVGNEYNLNGKSNKVEIVYLDIKNTLTLDNGIISWNAHGHVTQVRYRKEKETEKPKDLSPDKNGNAWLNLIDSGYYHYVILSIKGGLSQASMRIDSDNILIQNIYKNKNVEVSAAGNMFTIKANQLDLDYGDDYRFKVSNDKADGDSYISPSMNKVKTMTYVAGGTAEDADYRKTETTATEFYISSIGTQVREDASTTLLPNGIKLTISGEELTLNVDQEATFTKVMAGEKPYIILSSAVETVPAAMLKLSGIVTLKDNTITLTEEESPANGIITWGKAENAASVDGQVVYEVAVEYYNSENVQDSSTWEVTEKFFTTDTIFDSVKVASRFPNASYIFKVRAFAVPTGTPLTEEAINAAVCRYENGSYVLASSYIASKPITKTAAPTNVTVNNQGVIVWDYDTTANTKFGFVDEKGNIIEGEQNGNTFEAIGLEYSPNPYRIKMYACESDQIKSDLVAVKFGESQEVYKAPSVTGDDFDMIETDEGYTIDITKLLENKQILRSTEYYNVKLQVIAFYNKDGEEITLTSDFVESYDKNSKQHSNFKLVFRGDKITNEGTTIYIPEGYTSLKLIFDVVPSQSYQTFMVIKGNTEDFTLPAPSWQEEATVSWSTEEYRFNWTPWEGEKKEGDIPGYKVKVTYGKCDDDGNFIYDDNGKIIEIIETGETTNNFYQPRRMGKIISAQVYVRKNANSLYSKEPISWTAPDGYIEYKLFEAGDGTADNPYIIANEEQFNNMAVRNSAEYHFKQKEEINLNINVNGFAFNGTFFGQYDANWQTITVNMSGAEGGSENQTFYSEIDKTGQITVNYTKLAALFKEIGKGGSIKNLKLNVNYNLSVEGNLLAGGLALKNYGNISNVRITGQSMNMSVSGARDVAIGGLVAVNSGIIDSCVNEGSIQIRPSSNYNLSFSGFVVSNMGGGRIIHCENRANINIQSARANYYYRVAGIAINNIGSSSRIVESGNNGKILASGGAATYYLAGIVVRNYDGLLSYNYNNIAPECTSTNGKVYLGGIAYILIAGRINGNVEASGIKFAGDATRSPSGSNNLCYSGQGISGLTNTISERTISCGDGHSLVITKTGESYQVELK